MNYALFFKNISFYNELCTVRLGAILGTFLAPGGVNAEPEPRRAEPSRAGAGQASPSRAEPNRADSSRKVPNRAETSRAGGHPRAIFSKTTVFTMNYVFLYTL